MAKRKIDPAMARQVATFNQETINNPKFRKKQRERHRKQLQFLNDTAEEKELWNRFKELVRKKKEEAKWKNANSRVHFSFDHIDELGVEWDLLIIMGEKNIGKTYAQSQLVRKTIEEDPDSRVFFLRTTAKELYGAFKTQLEEGPEWPIVLKGGASGKGNPRLVWKKNEAKPLKYVHLKNGYYVGYAAHVNGNGMSSSQGGGYTNLRYCIWDEFNDDGNLKADYKQKLLRFFLSIQRNNANFKTIMCGNLLGENGKVKQHILLEEFGIPFNAKLKYRKSKHWDKKNEQWIHFKLLYINIGGADELYDGVNVQTFAYMFGEEAATDLLTNLPAYSTSKVVNKIVFLKSDPWFSFVVAHKGTPYCIYIAQVSIEWTSLSKSVYYVMYIDFYTRDNTELGYAPICDEIITTNSFGRLLKSWTEVLADKFQTIQTIIEKGVLYFANDATRELFNNTLYPMLCNKYKEHLEEWF